MLRAFTDGFRKFSELCFTSLGSARFNWHSFAQFLAWSSLLWLSMTWQQRFFTQKYFLSTTSLACSSALNLLFCSARSSLYGEKKETLPSSPPTFFIRTPLVAASVFLVKLLLHKRELTAQKMKLFIKDFFSNSDQIHSFLRMWSNLLKKSLMENFFLCSDYIKALEFVKITYTLFFEKLFLSHIHKRNWKLCI